MQKCGSEVMITQKQAKPKEIFQMTGSTTCAYYHARIAQAQI